MEKQRTLVGIIAERAQRAYQLYMSDNTVLDRDWPDITHDYYCDVTELLDMLEALRPSEQETREET